MTPESILELIGELLELSWQAGGFLAQAGAGAGAEGAATTYNQKSPPLEEANKLEQRYVTSAVSAEETGKSEPD